METESKFGLKKTQSIPPPYVTLNETLVSHDLSWIRPVN